MTKDKEKDEKKKNDWNFDAKVVRQMADLMKEKDLSEMEFSQGDNSIRLARGGAFVPAPVQQGATPAAAAPSALVAPSADLKGDLTNHPGAVKSPMVGVVYMRSTPEAAPFVSVGTKVTEGQTLCLIEAMKVFNPIVAEKAGTVKEILLQTGDLVEFDQVLFVIE